MFDTLTSKLGQVFDRLRGRGALSEADVNEAMREVRVALLEADVAIGVVKDFIETVKAKAVGQDVIKSVTPAQMVVKIVHDALVEMLGSEAADLNFGPAPSSYLMVGLQGSGKTTSTAKIARSGPLLTPARQPVPDRSDPLGRPSPTCVRGVG